MSRRTFIVVGIVCGVVAVGVIVAVAVAVVVGMGAWGHRFYVAEGTAVVPPAVVRHVGTPALVCSGHGGPLETSGVYGGPLGQELERPATVFCGTPTPPTYFSYRESVYSSRMPRRMHVYVWLERHPELESFCASQVGAVVNVDVRTLKGFGSSNPPDTPCFRPDPQGGLGYAIVFDGSSASRHETSQVELRAPGYP